MCWKEAEKIVQPLRSLGGLLVMDVRLFSLRELLALRADQEGWTWSVSSSLFVLVLPKIMTILIYRLALVLLLFPTCSRYRTPRDRGAKRRIGGRVWQSAKLPWLLVHIYTDVLPLWIR